MFTLATIKSQAKALRVALAERGIDLTHSACLDLVSRQHGHANWNTARAVIEGAPSADSAPLPLPQGWIGTGRQAERYRMGIDSAGGGAALIESLAGDRAPAPDAFGTLMQSIVADGFTGRRVRLSASLRTAEVVGAAVIWLRVDGERGEVLGFDNMDQRRAGLAGTRDWTGVSIVLDVPETARSLHYGFFLRGTGRVWAREFAIGTAAPDAPVTQRPPLLDGPTNLDFSSGAIPDA